MEGAEKVDMGANFQLKKTAGIILSAEGVFIARTTDQHLINKYHMFYYYETHENALSW